MADMTKNSTAGSKVAKVFIYLILGLLAVRSLFLLHGSLLLQLKKTQSFTEARGRFQKASISRTLWMHGKLQIWVPIC